LHPPAIKLSPAAMDSLTGEYRARTGDTEVTIFRQGDQLYEKDHVGDIDELAAESQSTFFYPNGSSIPRLIFQRDSQGRVTALVLHDDRHEERWEKRTQAASR